MTAMAARVIAGVRGPAVTYATERDVVVVSHVSPIKAAMTWALGVGTELAWRTHLDQASISRISFAPRGTLLRSFNETGHLSESLGPPRLSG